jgi:hypothetical protein
MFNQDEFEEILEIAKVLKAQDDEKPKVTERPTCETCDFWTPDSEDPHGICLRYPVFQRMSPANWCGEHQDFPAWQEWKRKNTPRP